MGVRLAALRSFASISIMRGGLPEINNIITLIDKTNSLNISSIQQNTLCTDIPLRSIGLADAYYMYPGSENQYFKE